MEGTFIMRYTPRHTESPKSSQIHVPSHETPQTSKNTYKQICMPSPSCATLTGTNPPKFVPLCGDSAPGENLLAEDATSGVGLELAEDIAFFCESPGESALPNPDMSMS